MDENQKRRKKMGRYLAVVFLGLLLMPTLGTLTADEANVVKIVSINLDLDKPLMVGQEVDLVVKVEYKLEAPSGMVVLNIQKGEIGQQSVNSIVASSTEVITKGTGELELKQKFVVPDTNALQVFTPLIISGNTQSQAVDYKVYKVVKGEK
jgi:hypothetical protein